MEARCVAVPICFDQAHIMGCASVPFLLPSCYGAQSGEVFITAIDNQATQQFQLVARQAELDKWQTHLQQLGFDLALANVA